MGKVKKKNKKKFSKFKLIVVILFILITAGGGTYYVTLLGNKDSGNAESTETSNKVEITYDKDNAEVTEESKEEINDDSSNEVVNNTESPNISNDNSESVVTEEADEEGFTKKKAVKYLRDDRVEYHDYNILEENGKFYFTNNGTKVIEISVWDIETSPVTGQNYYGYNLKKYGDDSSNEEFGMINQNGTVEVQ